MMPILNLEIPYKNKNIYTPGFRNLIENHLQYLKKEVSTKIINIDAHLEYKNQGDFYGLLIDLKVNVDLFWITMRLNDLHSPADYIPYIKIILVPTNNKITELLTRYINTMTIR